MKTKYTYPVWYQKFIRFYFSANAWKKWPTSSSPYGIPMSIYGCPDQELNNWRHYHLNVTFLHPHLLQKTTIGGNPYDPEQFTVGPFGDFNYQLNICKSRGSLSSDLDAEWPRGTYAIYTFDLKCPKGEFC